MQQEITRINILGVGVSAINMVVALETIRNWIDNNHSTYVCVAAAHSIMESRNDQLLIDIFNGSGLTTPDGMSLVWLLRARGYSHVDRVYGPDLLAQACREFSEFGVRHFFYGGYSDVTDRLIERLLASTPELQVAGKYTPPFGDMSPAEDSEVVEHINATNPDIVWVGIGSPQQERWMADHLGRLTAPVMIGVGAAFDLLSGEKGQAPRWIQRSGLEWFYRLSREPRRLWPRYRQYPLFALLALGQLAGVITFERDE